VTKLIGIFYEYGNAPKTDLTGTFCDVVDRIYVAYDRVKCQAVVKTVLKHQAVRYTEFVGDLRACTLLKTGCN
jgi:hypothetical protein